MTDYNLRHKFTSSRRVMESMKSVHYLPGSLRSMELQFKDVLSEYFDKWTVGEWIEQHVLPLQETVSALQERARTLTAAMVWPRRPLGAVVVTERAGLLRQEDSADKKEEDEEKSDTNVSSND